MISGGGYVINVQGVDCFMPGSLAGINKLHDFSSIIGTSMYVVPVSFSQDRGTIVVSHRKYLQAMIPVEISKLRENITERIVGNVTGATKYGVFCEFNTCLTGMIHINDLDEETLKRHKSHNIKPGEEIEFLVKDIVSNTKITLTQKTLEETNPWINIVDRYTVPSTVEASVKAVKDYGIFVTLEEGVVGLLHISEIGEELIKMFKGGDKITVQVTRIEPETKKVFLKLPS
jgi:small subunit ribosomal protein S1